jgi:hypothetical protein
MAVMASLYKQRTRSIEQARKQVPSKISNMGKTNRFERVKNAPGVGDYTLRDRWLKKSYNLKYNPKA